jgi:hypothetical protein
VNLDALGNIGDLVGGLGVLITLIYLSLQIRQNTRQVEQSLQVSRAQALRDTYNPAGWTLEAARNPEFAAFYARGMAQPEVLSSEEQFRFFFLMGTILGDIEKHHLTYEQGLLTDERWESQLRQLRFYFNQPGAAYYWQRFRPMHTRAFAEVVEQLRLDVGAPAPAV